MVADTGRTTLKPLYDADGNGKVDLSASTMGIKTVVALPANPTTGQVVLDTTTGKVYIAKD